MAEFDCLYGEGDNGDRCSPCCRIKEKTLSLTEWVMNSGGYLAELGLMIAAVCGGGYWLYRGFNAFESRYKLPTSDTARDLKKLEGRVDKFENHVAGALDRDQTEIRLLKESDRLLLRGHMAMINYTISGDDRDRAKLEEVRDDINDHLLEK